MSTLSPAPGLPVHAPFAGFMRWQRQGWRWFRRAPLALLGLAVLPILVEAVVQVGVPYWGVLLSKLVTPVAGCVTLIALHARMQEGALRLPQALAQAWRQRDQVLAITLLATCMFGLQLAVCLAIGGSGSTSALLHGDAAALQLSHAQLGLVLASAVPLSTLLLFVSPLALLRGQPFMTALRTGLVVAMRHRGALLIYCLAMSSLLVAMVFMPLLLLFMLPYATAVGYAAYRDVFDGARA